MEAMEMTHKTLPPSGPLESLSDERRAALSACGSFETAKPGEKIIHQGRPHARLMFTISGLLQAKVEERGHTEILGKIHPGEWLGEVNIFDPSDAVCSVEAVEPSEYWVITRDAFEKFINNNHTAGSILLIGFAMTLSKRIRNLTEKHVVTAKKTKNPFLRIGLAVVSLIAVAAIWNWIGGEVRIGSLRTLKQQGMAEVEQELEISKVKTKELELEVARLEEELEWAKSESEKKTAQPLMPNPPKTDPAPQAEVQTPKENQEPAIESAPSNLHPQEPLQAESTLPKHKSKPGEYPPELVLTKETLVPLKVNGKVSGSAKIAPGKTFKVVGVEESDVLVVMADSTVRIPKENSNFDEALEAAFVLAEEKAKAAAPAVSATPKPSATPVSTPSTSAIRREIVEAPAMESPLAQIEKMMKTLTPLKLVDALRDFRKPGKEGGRAAFMRSEGRKWEPVAEMAKDALRSQSPDQASTKLLKNIVLVTEMFQTERYEGIEGKLNEIDAGWLVLKTDLEIYGPDGAPTAFPPAEQ